MQYLTKQSANIFWNHTKKYRWQTVVVIIGMVLVPFIKTYIPLKYRDLINLLAEGNKPGVFDLSIKVVFLILMLNIFSTLLRRAINFVTNFLEPAVMRDLANTCFEYLQQHSFGFFSSNFVGSLVTKVRRYERAYEKLSDQVAYDLGASLLLTGMVITALLMQYPLFGWITLGWTIVFMVFSYIVAKWKLPYDIARAASDSRVTAQLADGITNNTNIKLFTNYEKENERFKLATHEQFRIRKKSTDLGTIADFLQGLFMLALEFGLIYLGVVMWSKGTLRVGDVALLQVYIIGIFDKLWNTGKNLRMIYEALADANEMTEMLIAPHSVQDIKNAKTLAVSEGRIDFSHVAFGYHDETSVLKDFNLVIKPGERVAFIGPSGGGKSTILRLLFRFHDLNGGSIAIDGQDISGVTQDSLRANLSLVPQDPILFHRTLLENIRYAKPAATDEQVIQAAKLAHAHDFISAFPRGYETLVGERGIKLSGGERQRVAIARAILKDAPILVLDEATSSLDSESEMFIQDSLKKLMKNRTTIVVAHRLSTIMQMDRILVIEDGKIVEQGKHEELLKARQGTYQKLWEIQAGGFSMN